jgi:DNA-binding transcriptional ArsR family regulator
MFDMDLVIKFERVYKNMRLLTHQDWITIIDLLYDGKPRPVKDITVALRKEQSWCSQGLAKLKRAGIVDAKRKGKMMMYSINREKVDAYTQAVRALSNI